MQYSGATMLSTLRLLRILYAILVLSVIVCGFIFRPSRIPTVSQPGLAAACATPNNTALSPGI